MWAYNNFSGIFRIAAVTLAMTWLPACGGDDDDDTTKNVGNGGSGAGQGGTSSSGESGKGGGTSGAGGIDWTKYLLPDGGINMDLLLDSGIDLRGLLGDGGFGQECSETAPTSPVVCGGVTCTVTESDCLYPCCAKKDGKEVCGGKYATSTNPVACQPYPPVADTRCPNYTGTSRTGRDGGSSSSADAGGTVYQGCCTPDSICGIISKNRYLCVTSSQSVTLPDPPLACNR